MKRESVERSTVLAGYAWLVFVGLCVATMSFAGLVGFAEDNLDMTRPWSLLVPVALDGTAVTLAFLALRSVLAGDAAGFPRVLAWVVVLGGASANYYHAETIQQGQAAALFFAGMTCLVYLLFEVVLRQLRRRHLREVRAVEAPLPRFRPARWLRFPRLTFRAWSAAVRYGLTDPAEALRQVQIEHTPLPSGLVDQAEERPELEVRERTTTERSITARNGTQAAKIAELAGQGYDLDGIVQATGFKRDSVRVALKRIEQGNGS